MIFFSQKRYQTGGKRQYPVRKLSADSVEAFEELLHVLGPLEGSWWTDWPVGVAQRRYNDNRVPVAWVRETELPALIAKYGVVELPSTYFELEVFKLKKKFCSLEPGSLDSGSRKKRRNFWTSKFLWQIGKIHSSGEFVPDPDIDAPTFPCSEKIWSGALKTINAWIENFDLRHRKRVNPAKIGRNRPVMVSEEVKEFFSLSSEDEKSSYLASSPWLIDLMAQVQGELDSGKIKRLPNGEFVYTSS